MDAPPGTGWPRKALRFPGDASNSTLFFLSFLGGSAHGAEQKSRSSAFSDLRDTARAMSQENVERLRAVVEVFLAGTSEPDREAMLTKITELYDPDMKLDSSEGSVLDVSGVYRGTGAAKQFWREWLAAWETTQFEYELVDAGDRIVQLFDMRMRGRSTGIEMPFGKVAWVYTFRDGLIVHMKLYMSQAEALEAVGLTE
jgi:SnoaL-like domain